MTIQELLDKLRGSDTKVALAERLGISLRMLTALYAGDRGPGNTVVSALLREYPEHRTEIVDTLFFVSGEHDSAEPGTPEPITEPEAAS